MVEKVQIAMRKCHRKLVEERERVLFAEAELSGLAQRLLSELPLRETSRAIGISAAYLSDIRHGRRKVSDAIVEKLGALK